jgi:hypothetical protein
MKKIICVVAAVAIVGVGGFYYANGKVEDELNASIKKANESNPLSQIEGKVSTNILLGTLKVKDLQVKSADMTQQGNLEISGLKFYNRENAFSDKVSIVLNDYKTSIDQNYTSDNSFSIAKDGEGKLDIKATAAFVGSANKGNISQEYNAKVSNVGDFYDAFTKDLTDAIVHNQSPSNPVGYITKLSGAKLDMLTLTVNNDHFIKNTLVESAKSKGATEPDAELLSKMNVYVEDQIKKSVPTTDGAQDKVLSFYKEDKGSLTIKATNISNKSLFQNYSDMMLSGDVIFNVITKNYKIEVYK